MDGGDVLRMEDGHPVMVDQTKFGWHGCWRCEHCLANASGLGTVISTYSAEMLSKNKSAERRTQ